MADNFLLVGDICDIPASQLKLYMVAKTGDFFATDSNCPSNMLYRMSYGTKVISRVDGEKVIRLGHMVETLDKVKLLPIKGSGEFQVEKTALKLWMGSRDFEFFKAYLKHLHRGNS